MKYSAAPGKPYPLGVTFDGNGINVALFSANATKVELCLFDDDAKQETQRIRLPEYTDEIWHGYIADIKPGALYGFRVHGPFEPHNGHRFNANKLLLDPYTRALKGELIWSDTHLAYDIQSTQKDLTLDQRDNAAFMPKCVVTAPAEKASEYHHNNDQTRIIYELHVKGFSQLNPDIPVELQGTYAALGEATTINYLQNLGVTSVELLPVHAFFDEPFVLEKGLNNYWGYNSINFFSPANKYSHSDDAITELRNTVTALHNAGIEVILDVVYNHTAEGNHLGPTFCFKGIDNASYYCLDEDDARYYVNHSGCGNTLNLEHPRVLQLVLDSLRYWVEMVGIDGFRFDLAPILGRESKGFSAKSAFFKALHQDPVLTKVKMIAEPWDIGPGGYQLGRFPSQWLEWNDRFRDATRRFWRGDSGMLPEFAKRLHGSSDLFEQRGRHANASVNFITAHDGFTLNDLVSYNQQHNQANGEENKDGHSSNFSNNYGVEGHTDDAEILAVRMRQQRNLLTTLFIAQGTPMLLAGDEFGNSQRGNNNAYCQDNEIAWLQWQTPDCEQHKELRDFVRRLINLRQHHPLLNRPQYQHGTVVSTLTHLPDISWINPAGDTMSEQDWHNEQLKSFGMLLGDIDSARDEDDQDDALLMLFNANNESTEFTLPDLPGCWQVEIDTANPANEENNTISSPLHLTSRSCLLLSYSHNTQTGKSLSRDND